MPLDELLDNYPSVTREQVGAVLDFLADSADPVFSGEPDPATVIHAHSSR